LRILQGEKSGTSPKGETCIIVGALSQEKNRSFRNWGGVTKDSEASRKKKGL